MRKTKNSKNKCKKPTKNRENRYLNLFRGSKEFLKTLYLFCMKIKADCYVKKVFMKEDSTI